VPLLANQALSPWEAAARLFEPSEPIAECQWLTPGDMAKALDQRTVQTSALDLIDEALVDVAGGRCLRLMISMPPQEGKSERTSRRFPLWALRRNPNLRISIVSYAHSIARRWGQRIRDDIVEHGNKLGLAIDPGSSAAHEWKLAGHDGEVYCVGIKGSLTSRAVDLLIVDDPYKDGEQADSPAWNDTVRDFWTEVAIPRLGPGVAVVIIQTRWRHDDLSGWLQRRDDGVQWRVINIPAQADHRPELGQTDPLGREPGDYMVSARGRTVAQWEQRRREVGERSWNALFQGRPTPETGAIFEREWWQFYDTPQWVDRPDGSRWAIGFDELITSWDLAFKDTAGCDYVCGQVWGRRGVDAYLLDQVHDRLGFVATCQAMRGLAARWPQAILKLVEDKANGPAVINQLRRTVPGLVPVEPDGSKQARAAAVSPFVEGGNVLLPAPELAPWVDGVIEEAQAFPRGAHDDRVDTMTQALNRLLLSPLIVDDEVLEDPEDDDYTISPY
jgi:predicted phage terminase large subunit-like protein